MAMFIAIFLNLMLSKRSRDIYKHKPIDVSAIDKVVWDDKTSCKKY